MDPKEALKIYLLHVTIKYVGSKETLKEFNEALAEEMQNDVLELLPIIFKDLERVSKIALEVIVNDGLKVTDKKDVN